MRTHGVNSISFSGNLIDSHMHIGRLDNAKMKTFDINSLDVFVKNPLDITVGGVKQQDNISKVLISNLDCMAEGEQLVKETEGNLAVLEICKNNPKYYPIAVCNPKENHHPGNSRDLRALLRENPGKFVGLKFHPNLHDVPADSDLYREYMRLAEINKLPCLFHSNVDFDEAGDAIDGVSAPETIYRAAKEFPDVPVIMAHMGAGGEKAHENALQVLLKSIDNNDAKLYVDISWVDWGKNGTPGLSTETKPSVVKLLKELQQRNKLDRVLFGTDAPLGCYGEAVIENISPKQAYEQTVQDLKNVIKTNFGNSADDIIEKVFYKNADELYFQKNWTKGQQEVVKTMSTLKVGGIIVGVLAVLSLIKYLMGKSSKAPSREELLNDK